MERLFVDTRDTWHNTADRRRENKELFEMNYNIIFFLMFDEL